MDLFLFIVAYSNLMWVLSVYTSLPFSSGKYPFIFLFVCLFALLFIVFLPKLCVCVFFWDYFYMALGPPAFIF